jgi:hypothetical protein
MMGQAVAVAPQPPVQMVPSPPPDLLLLDADPLIERYVADIRASSRSLMLKRSLLGGSTAAAASGHAARFARSTSCVHTSQDRIGKKVRHQNTFSFTPQISNLSKQTNLGGSLPDCETMQFEVVLYQ